MSKSKLQPIPSFAEEIRFASFESWKTALEQEWDTEAKEIAGINAAQKQINSDYINLQTKKLQFYKNLFYGNNPVIELDDIEYLEEKLKKKEFAYFQYTANEIDANLDSFFKEYDPASFVYTAKFKQRFEGLSKRNKAVEEKLKEKGTLKQRNEALANQKYYTDQYITALESNDKESLQTLEGNKHLHPDITSKRFLVLTERTHFPVREVRAAASSKTVKIVEERNSEAQFKRSDSPATFVNNHVLGWQKASKRIIAAANAQRPSAESDRNSPTRSILKVSAVKAAQEEAAKRKAEAMKLREDSVSKWQGFTQKRSKVNGLNA